MQEYYLFETEAELAAFIAAIDAQNAAIDPPPVRMTTWAVPKQRASDGKWVCKRIPAHILAAIPAAVVEGIQGNFTFTIEPWDLSWEPLTGEAP